MQLSDRNIINGLEGCGKSSLLFQHLSQITTPDKPVLFGVKNYALMTEQVNNWSIRFNVPLGDFFIAGKGGSSESALVAFTNPITPYILNRGVRFVFTSQANIQRNNHLSFRMHDGKPVQWSHLIIDEFDFKLGIIPSLDYELSRLRKETIEEDFSDKLEEQKLRWIEQNYTFDDRIEAVIATRNHEQGFFLAHWIKSCNCPLTFLTSEVLASRFLELLEFERKNIGVSNFPDCKVNIWANPHINKTWFNTMNQEVAWDEVARKYNYDLLISDCILPFFSNNPNQGVEVTVINHLMARGSNAYQNSQILTILNYIPSQAIAEIVDTFNYFGDNISFDEVETLFYRDRVCQSIGRVLGYRGSESTDVICHSSILEKLNKVDFPYTLNTNWDFNFEGLDQILLKVESKREFDRTIKALKSNKADSYSYLDKLLVKNPGSYLPVSELKEFFLSIHLKGKRGATIPATKVAKYFNCEIKNLYLEGKYTRCLIGLEIAK